MHASPTRRLAAIMFTDIVGYTSLMQHNEAQAVVVRKRHRQVFEQQHNQFQGQILQYFGDGTLSVFQSGVEAVSCAIAIQHALQAGEKVPLRIGLHVGDIVFDGTEIYGDGVNLAARIESMGVPGAILLSARLNDEFINHPQISTISLGHFELKNVARPLEVFAVSNAGIRVPQREELKGKQKLATKSIAVLPFVNMSTNEENEYFCDGMTEEIINALAKIEELKVTSRTSSFFFKNKNIPIRQIGKELNVSTILEGSIRLGGNTMRITAQLIDVAEDVHFWSETFDRSVQDVFAVQDEISLLIADKLREHLGHLEIGDQLVEAPNIPVDTYQRYLKGRYHILKMTKPHIEQGLTILEGILQTHPQFALAHVGIHLGYTMLGTLGLMPAIQAFEKGQPYLEKAIELDEDLPECQLNLSYIAFLQKWDLKSTYTHLQKAFELRPTVEYYQSMASVLVSEGKFEAALNYIETALQLDPFSGINYHLKGYIFYCQERYPQAIELFTQAIDLDTHFMASTLYKGQALLLSGQQAAGLAYFQALPMDESGDVTRVGGLTLTYAAQNDLPKVEAGIHQLEAALDTEVMERALNFLILCQAMLGNQAETLQLIEQGISYRLPMMVYLFVEPMLKPLRTHPQFQKLMRQVLGEETVFVPSQRKYKKTLLDTDSLQSYKDQLEQFMNEKHPYLNPDLTLRDLAKALTLPPNYVSQLLNEGFDKNFSEYINSYRLEAFKAKVADPANHHLTILGLAFESGFNSKTVFNTYFKKTMGKTPSAYWKEVAGK